MLSQTIIDKVYIEQNDGLHQRTVNKVIRNHDGFFYLFMDEAIQRFDGSKFEYVNLKEMFKDGVKPNDITDIAMIENGILSISVSNENHHYFIKPNALSVKSLPVNGNTIHGNKSLYSIEEQDQVYVTSRVTLTENNSINTTKILSLDVKPKKIIQTNDNDYYIQDNNDNIYFYTNDKFTVFPIPGNIIKSNGKVYLWTTTSIYKIIKEEISEISKIPNPSKKITILKNDNSGNTIALFSSRKNFQDNAYVLTKDEELVSFKSIVDYSKLTKDIWTDDAFYKWMLVGFTNVKVVSLQRKGVDIVNYNQDVKKGSFGNIVSGVAADNKGNVIFTNETSGFYTLTGPSTYTSVFDSSIIKNKLYNNGKIYFSPYDNNFYNYNFRYDGTTSLFRYNTSTKSLNERKIPFKLNDFLPIENENIVLGGYILASTTGKLAIYNYKTNRVKEIESFDHNLVLSIDFCTELDEYWIGTSKGIYIYDIEWNKIGNISSRGSKDDQSYIENETIKMINTYRGKKIVGTLGGVYVIDTKSKKVEKFINRTNGLSNNMAIGIMPDDIGNCWISTFNGMNIMDSTFTIVKKIYDHQGLPEREFNSKSIAKDKNGLIYAGTINGLGIFDPKKVLNWKETYGLSIEGIYVHEGKKTEQLDLSGQNQFYKTMDSITIDYSHPDYYKYPFLEKKIAISSNDTNSFHIDKTKQRVSINSVPLGESNLTFHNLDTNSAAKIKLHSVRDYRMLWIFLLSLVFISLLSYIIITYNKKKTEERAKLNHRIAELQLTSLQAQMNPHFIFNALGAIQYFIQTHNAEKADEYLSDFAMLMRNILESSKSKYITVKQEIETLKLYLRLEQIRFEKEFNYEFQIDDELITDMKIPPMIIQPYIENAVNHGIHNLKDRFGNLIIKFEQLEEDTLKITVRDNGIGRKAAEKLKRKNHKSRGMQIIKERINTINNNKELKLDIHINDLMYNHNATGTEVVILISETI